MPYFVGINQLPLTSASPATNAGTVTTGTSSEYARADHDHGAATELKSATTVIDVSSATAPTTGQVLTATGGSAATWQTPAAGGVSVAIIADQKTQNTSSQTLSATTWNQRDLNTILFDSNSIVSSVSSNTFTLISGSYEISWNAPVSGASINCFTRLVNHTDTTVVGYGSNHQNLGTGYTYLTTNGTKAFKIEHYVASIGSGGNASNISGISEVYTQVRIVKVS